MKIANIAMATLMAMGVVSFGAQAVDPAPGVTGANSGSVTFTGEVVDTPCSLAPGQDGMDVKVPFGQLSLSQLNAGVKPSAKFNIELRDCALTGKTAKIKFDGRANAANELLTTQGSATNLGIGITGIKFGTAADLNAALLGKDLVNGKNTLVFTATASKLAAEAVTAGDFTAIANFTITYA